MQVNNRCKFYDIYGKNKVVKYRSLYNNWFIWKLKTRFIELDNNSIPTHRIHFYHLNEMRRHQKVVKLVFKAKFIIQSSYC